METKKTKNTEPKVATVETTTEVVNAVLKPTQQPINNWEIKDRTYFLKSDKKTLTVTIPSRHSRKVPLLWFDKETGVQKELRYATNQNSPLVEEQKGEATLGHIMFKDGTLFVPKEKQNLQKLLSLYHPLINKIYYEYDKVEEAEDDLDYLELEIDALNAAMQMEIDAAEAVLRVEFGTKVSSMTSKEIRRDILLFARRNPELFIALANDENVQLRNVAIRASELGIIKLSQDQRSFSWGSNGRKLMNIPFDENPYSAMAAWFKTDEGVEVYRNIEKNLK